MVLLLAPACGEETAPPRAAAAPSPTDEAAALEALRAIGYTSWDEAPSDGSSGVVVHDAARAHAGVNLYTNDVDEAYALDMDGRVLHTWRIPGRTQVEFFRLLEGGRALAISVDQGVTLVDRESNVLWSVDFPAHHEVCALADGTFLVPFWEEHEDYRGRAVRFDGMLRLSADGAELDRWRTWDHLEELQKLHPPLVLDTAPPPGSDEAGQVYDYYHLNSIHEVGPNARDGDPRFRVGNLLLCFRNANLVVLLDGETREVVWHWRPGTLDMPHMPTMLANGNVLIFDNGHHRGWSRILEIDPTDGSRVWSWRAEPKESFFTKGRGSCQRLANGNTLICESERGHVFEVTREGDVVWDFWNPEVKNGKRKRIYRFLRLSEDAAGIGD